MNRKEQKEQTARLILECAKDEFEKEGFESTGIREIARRAGVSAGTVLHHFTDKSDLLHACFFEDLQGAIHEFFERPSGRGLEARLEQLTVHMFLFYQQRPLLYRSLLKESLFAEPPWSERFREQTTQVHAWVVAQVDTAKREGELSPECDSNLMALSYLSYFYFALLSFAQGFFTAPEQPVMMQVRQLLAGCRGEGKKQSYRES